MNKIKLFLAALVAALVLAPKAYALPLEDLEIREADKSIFSRIVKSSEAVSMRLKYGGSSSEAYVSILDTNMLFQAPNGTRDSAIGNNGQFDLSQSTNDTMGELCDAINAGFDSNAHEYQCVLEDGKRDDGVNLLGNVLSTPTLTNGDLKQGNGYEVLFDNAPGDNFSSGGQPVRFESLGIVPEKGKRVVLKQCSWKSSSITPFTVYGRLKKFPQPKDGSAGPDGEVRRDNTVAFSLVSAASVTFATNFVQQVGTGTLVGANLHSPATLLDMGGIEFDKDAHVVVRNANNGVTTLQPGDNLVNPSFIDCSWIER